MTTYALDSSGAASANFISGETTTVNTLNQVSDTYVFPTAGPFFENGLIVNYTPVGGVARPLTVNVDYAPDFAIKGVLTGNDIFGALRIINKTLAGSISYSYHALGGNWTLLQSAILQAVSTTAIDPHVAYFGLTASPPITIPGTTAPLALNSSTALALAQSLNPSGVQLTITPFELPEAEQLDILNPPSDSGSSGGGDNSGGTPDMSSNYAQETGGNLATIAQEVTLLAQGQAAATTAAQTAATASTSAATAMTAAATALASAGNGTGTVADVAYGGSGSASLVAIEKGSYGHLASMDTKLSGTLTVAGAAAAPLALDATVSALGTTMSQILTAIKGTQAIDGSVWMDITLNPVHYYVRREVYSETLNAYVVSWENTDGTTASPTLANLVIAGASSSSGTNTVDQINLNYNATAAGTGFSIGDTLIHSYGLNTATSPATLSYSVWLNASTGTVLTSVPSAGSIAQMGMSSVTVTSSVLPTNAAVESGGNLALLATGMGTPSDTAYNGTGSSSLIAAVRGLYAAIKGTLQIRNLASGTDSVTTVPSGTQTVAGSVTVSGTVTTDGTAATGVNQLSGGAGTQGWLSGIFSKLSGTLSTVLGAGAAHIGSVSLDAALPSGGNTIGNVGVNGTVGLAPGSNTIGAVTAPAGASLALSSDITNLGNIIKATVGITGTVWFDPSVNPPVYYVRRESVNEGTGVITVSWLNPDGTAASPSNLAKLQISGDAQNLQTENITYVVGTAATGIAVGDIVIHALAIDRSTSLPAVAYNFWINATQGTVLASAPAAGNISQQAGTSVTVSSSALPTNAAQETGGHLAAIDTAQGTIADAAWGGTGSASVVSILKAMFMRLTGVSYVIGSDGVLIPIESIAHTLGYSNDGNNNLLTDMVTYNGHTYTQTLTWVGGNCTNTSNWLQTS